MSKEIERFRAQSEDGSYKTTIIITQESIRAPTRANPSEVVGGMMEAHTIDGDYCNLLDDGRFKVVGTEIILTRIR